MCLATAGVIVSIEEPTDGDPLWRQGEVDFGGVRQRVSLACLPAAIVGDRVLVHVGLALAPVDDQGAWP